MTKPRLVGINKLMINKEHQELSFNSNRFRIGRSLEMDLCLLDLNISRLHCVFAKSENSWTVFCKSSNGIRVNGERLEKDMQMELKHGDTIKLAEQQIYYWRFYLEADQDESGGKVEKVDHGEEIVKNHENGDKMEIINIPDSNRVEMMGLGQEVISKNLLLENTKEELEQTGIDKRNDVLHKEIEEINEEVANIREDMKGKKTEDNESMMELKLHSKEKRIEKDDVKIVRPLFKPPNGYACAQDILRRVQNKMRLKKNKKASINISEDKHDQDDSILSTSTNQSFSNSDSSQTNACNMPETSSQCSQMEETMPDASACSQINACKVTLLDSPSPSSQIEMAIPDTSSPIFRRASKKASRISKGLLKLKKLL